MQTEAHPAQPGPATELVEPRGTRPAVLGWLLGIVTSVVSRLRTRRRRPA